MSNISTKLQSDSVIKQINQCQEAYCALIIINDKIQITDITGQKTFKYGYLLVQKFNNVSKMVHNKSSIS